MASHGIPRVASKDDKSAEAIAKEAKEILKYRALVDEVDEEVRDGSFTPELLTKTAEVLKTNPEYYTIWNHRRRIFANEFESIIGNHAKGELTEENRDSQVLDIINLDLQFLLPLLIQFPKCYWIWNHRLWLLEQATRLLPLNKSRTLWEDELGLVGKMLNRDSRNFHGWDYRRTIIHNLESKRLDGASRAQEELDYTTKMIRINLSNFSAWHNRSKLILRVLDEKDADDDERRKMLDDELALIHNALFDPYDQSLWFYHQNLLCAFDPRRAPDTMAPKIPDTDRLEYLVKEVEFIKEILEDVEDCKWVYQALVECQLLISHLQGTISATEKEQLRVWVNELKKMDNLRAGRWNDLEQKLGLEPVP